MRAHNRDDADGARRPKGSGGGMSEKDGDNSDRTWMKDVVLRAFRAGTGTTRAVSGNDNRRACQPGPPVRRRQFFPLSRTRAPASRLIPSHPQEKRMCCVGEGAQTHLRNGIGYAPTVPEERAVAIADWAAIAQNTCDAGAACPSPSASAVERTVVVAVVAAADGGAASHESAASWRGSR